MASKERPNKRKIVIGNKITRFNGVELERENHVVVITVNQSQYIKKMENIVLKKIHVVKIFEVFVPNMRLARFPRSRIF